jgi:hypothetical protein
MISPPATGAATTPPCRHPASPAGVDPVRPRPDVAVPPSGTGAGVYGFNGDIVDEWGRQLQRPGGELATGTSLDEHTAPLTCGAPGDPRRVPVIHGGTVIRTVRVSDLLAEAVTAIGVMMDLLNAQQLTHLADGHGGTRISLFLPTHRGRPQTVRNASG